MRGREKMSSPPMLIISSPSVVISDGSCGVITAVLINDYSAFVIIIVGVNLGQVVFIFNDYGDEFRGAVCHDIY